MKQTRRPYQSTKPTIIPLPDYEQITSPALRVIHKFGGARRLSKVLAEIGRPYSPSTIYRWTYPRPRGMNGLIPTAALPDIIMAARFDGVILTPEDFDPRTNLAPKGGLTSGPKPLPRDSKGYRIYPNGKGSK